MLKQRPSAKSAFHDQRGMAIMELIPILIIMVILINYSLGFFGAIHTGILNSMSARNYAFQTFNHRSNLVYFRDTANSGSDHFEKYGMRLHATISEKAKVNNDVFQASGRRIDFLEENQPEGDGDLHNNRIYGVIDGVRYEKEGVNPIWVRPQYGICLNSVCGPQ